MDERKLRLTDDIRIALERIADAEERQADALEELASLEGVAMPDEF